MKILRGYGFYLVGLVVLVVISYAQYRSLCYEFVRRDDYAHMKNEQTLLLQNIAHLTGQLRDSQRVILEQESRLRWWETQMTEELKEWSALQTLLKSIKTQ